jgi:hypothetical protein
MSEREPKRLGAGWVVMTAGGGLALLFIAYLLGSGPGMWLVQKHYLSAAVYEAIYSPLLYVSDHVAWVDGPLTSYCRWWVGQ